MLSLGIHDRSRVIASLSRDETDALVACFGSVADATEELEHLASRTLGRLRDHRHWLACSCTPSAGEGAPLMAPRQREGVLHIFRLGGALHALDCPFFRDPAEASGDTGVASVGQGAMRPAGDTWLTLDNYTQKTASEPSEEEDERPRTTRDRKSSLAVVLFTALESIGLSRIQSSDVRSLRGKAPCASPTAEHYKRLAGLNEREVAPGIPWRIAGCTYMPALDRFMAKGLPAHIDAFGAYRPQGLFIGLIQSIEREESRAVLHWHGAVHGAPADVRVSVDGTLKRFGAARDSTGPFWCAAAVGRRLGESQFRVLAAYVHPVFSKTLLFPVDSNLERLTAAILLDQLSYWAKATTLGIEVQLLKPLFDLQSADGEWCRPDFILELPNESLIVIETMGRDDPDYLAAKERTHKRMRGIPGTVDLVTYRPGQDDESEFRRTLTRLVREYS